METSPTITVRRPGRRDRLSIYAAGAALILSVIILLASLLRLPGATGSAVFLPPLIAALFDATAIWLFWVRRAQPGGRALVMTLSGVAAALAMAPRSGVPDFPGSLFLFLAGLSLAGGAFVHLAFTFPRLDPIFLQAPWLRRAGLTLGAVAWAAAVIAGPQAGPTVGLLFTVACILFWLVWIARRMIRTGSATDQEQMRLLFIAGAISFVPVGAWLLSARFAPASWNINETSRWLLITLVLFPLLIGYTIQRYRFLHTDYILSRAVLYGLLSALFVLAYTLMVAGVGLVVAGWQPNANPVYIAMILFVLVLLLNPVRDLLKRTIDRAFFRGEQVYQEQLQLFSSQATRSLDLPAILSNLRQVIERTLAPTQLHIFIYDALYDLYLASAGASRRASTDLRFHPSAGLAPALADRNGALLLSEQDAFPLELAADRSRITMLGAQVFVPLPGQHRMPGFLALGPRLSGEPYTSREVTFLMALADAAALAIERARVLEDVQQRVREMNVLTRVAQGVNITVNFDDMLELVYAQTTQILPANDFSVILCDATKDQYTTVFSLENGERISSRENRPEGQLPMLEQEIIRQRRQVRTADYRRECTLQGLIAARSGIYAWMGVPLNAGAEVIGSLCLGSRDPSLAYTPQQLDLLQALADQAAGAIVKSRLLQESERRTRQLGTLNEVTRQLTSTLEIDPLLKNILHSAVEILNCEAGSLLLVDFQTDELVFQVVESPVANDLLHKRIPSSAGLAGKAVNDRKIIVVNDVTKSPEWFSKTDKETGFVTRSLLVIPLAVKDRVIGVIEVLNKRDGTAFLREDEDLLAAFAAQAAVVIENARLYTLTDQALAERVEELSVMQRIDRELNTGLEISRAMRITLEWAMRQSGAQAGLVGVVSEEGVQIMASQGYTGELTPYEQAPLPIDVFALGEVIASGAPLRRALGGGVEHPTLLHNGRSQAVIPIRRETSSIGLILLESTGDEACSEIALNFVSRLSDHASVAIVNAQLYAAIQAANLAKSEFVSFVAHELKNPMTSVKGYTELLAAGAVGPVNDAQANFLSVIRANIERMNTLVSDLNDMSKIEVGRLRLDFKPIQLSEVIDSVQRSTRRQVDEKKQTLLIKLPPDLSPVWADRTRLEQVLVNLVSNAHKYTQAEGEIIVSAERAANRWDSTGPAEVIHVWVKDNGIGISEEDQVKIFQKFFRSEDPKTREAPGTGLGLNITRSLVEMQGGRIWFDSVFRQGTTFHFTVPIAES